MASVAKALLAFLALAAAPLHAQSGTSQAQSQPGQRDVTPPAHPYGYVEPWLIRDALQPKDERTPRQRCIDAETAKLGGSVSDLAASSIDLACSQR